MNRLLAALRRGWLVAVERLQESLDAVSAYPAWALVELPFALDDALRRGYAMARGELRDGPGYADRVEKLQVRYGLMFTPEDRALFELRLYTKCDWGEIAKRLSTPARKLDAAAVESRYAEIRGEFRTLARHCGLL